MSGDEEIFFVCGGICRIDPTLKNSCRLKRSIKMGLKK